MAERLVHTGYMNYGASSESINLYVTYSTSTNYSNNTSTITCGMYVSIGGKGNIGPWTDGSGSYCGTSGHTFNGSIPNFSGSYTLCSGHTFTVSHNSDGTGSAEIVWKWGVNSPWGQTQRPSGSFWIGLPTIPKAAKITSAENFTDEGNPTIKYSNPAGNSASTLQACISFDGYTIEVPYRDIPKKGSSYTFNLTDDERAALLAGCSNAKSKSILFYVKSVVNGTQTLTKIEKTFSVVNAEPTMTPTVVDVNPDSLAITNDETKLIKFFSTAKCLVNYELKKGATLSNIQVTHNGLTKYMRESYWYDIESNEFEFILTDSRGYTITQKVVAPLFDYVKLTCDVKVSMNVSGTAYLSITGNFYNKQIGSEPNYLVLLYQYRRADESYKTLHTATVALSGDSYYTTVEIPNLDYRSTYYFQAVATDNLMQIFSAETVGRATPVFDWGENDFNFNVPITIQGRGYGENKILWEGAMPMGNGQSINLYGGKISEQPHGIVLIFTGFDEPNPLNQSVCSHFVSKKQVELFGDSVGHTFILGYNATLAKFGAKYLYFSDEQIKGHSGNTTYGGATPGFEIDNTYWCLRYVIGV